MEKVIIYTSNTCAYCEMAKEYFKNKGYEYEERNISNPEHRKFLMQLGVRGVPTIMVGDKHVVGFDQEEVEKLISEAKSSSTVNNEDGVKTIPNTEDNIAEKVQSNNEDKIGAGIAEADAKNAVGYSENGAQGVEPVADQKEIDKKIPTEN